MSKIGVIGLFALLTACAAVPSTNVEQQIRALEQEQARAAIAGERATLERLFAPEFRVINPAGAVASKAELLQLLAGGASPYRSANYETQTVDVFSDVVVSVGLESVVPNQGAQAGQTVRRRITHVWRREGSAWVLALRHATNVAN